MSIAKDERPELHNGNEAREIHDFGVGIATIDDPGEVEELRALVNFCPETFFKGVFSAAESGSFFYEVDVCEDTNDFWETMGLKDI